MSVNYSIVIYTKDNCSYCDRAKALFDKIGLQYQEISMNQATPEALNDMLEKSQGRRTFPQIFINEKPIGGFDDLHALYQSGTINSLLKSD